MSQLMSPMAIPTPILWAPYEDEVYTSTTARRKGKDGDPDSDSYITCHACTLTERRAIRTRIGHFLGGEDAT